VIVSVHSSLNQAQVACSMKPLICRGNGEVCSQLELLRLRHSSSWIVFTAMPLAIELDLGIAAMPRPAALCSPKRETF